MAKKGTADFSECPLCYDTYEDPRFLPNCGHTFCLKCIKQNSKDNSLSLECPLCRELSSVTSEGLDGLPKNFVLISLLDNFSSNSGKALDVKSVGHLCLKHVDEELILVCVDCSTPVCEKCHEEKHKTHRMSAVRKFVRSSVESLHNDAKETDLKLLEIGHKKDELRTQKEEFLNRITDQEMVINREFQSMRSYFESEKDKLLEELKCVKQSVLKSLEKSNEEFEYHELACKSLKMSIQQMEKIAETGANFTAVDRIKELKEQLNNLSTGKTENKMEESASQHVKFISADLKSFLVNNFVTYERPNIFGKLQLDPLSAKKEDGDFNESAIDPGEPFGLTSATMFLPSSMFHNKCDMRKQLEKCVISSIKFRMGEDGATVIEGDYINTRNTVKRLTAELSQRHKTQSGSAEILASNPD